MNYGFRAGSGIMEPEVERCMTVVEYAYMSHPGKIRKSNQDNLICVNTYLPMIHGGTGEPVAGSAELSRPLLFGVFDGMGGEEHGEAASFLAAKAAASGQAAGREGLDALCREANRAICRYVSEHGIRSSGTTAAMLLFDGDGVAGCHIGDSRIYRIRQGQAEQLTKDDAWPSFPGRKPPLLQCLGIPEDEMRICPHVEAYPADPGQLFLICTDGLSDMVKPEQMADILRREVPLKQQARMLVEEALEAGGWDNVTVMLVRTGKSSIR